MSRKRGTVLAERTVEITGRAAVIAERNATPCSVDGEPPIVQLAEDEWLGAISSHDGATITIEARSDRGERPIVVVDLARVADLAIALDEALESATAARGRRRK